MVLVFLLVFQVYKGDIFKDGPAADAIVSKCLECQLRNQYQSIYSTALVIFAFVMRLL